MLTHANAVWYPVMILDTGSNVVPSVLWNRGQKSLMVFSFGDAMWRWLRGFSGLRNGVASRYEVHHKSGR